MRNLRLLSTAAAIVLIGGGVAVAQGMHEGQANGPAERAPAAQRHAPAEKMGPAIHSQRKTPETTGQAERSEHERGALKPGGGAEMHKNQLGTKGNKSRETTGQAPGENRKAEEHNGKPEMKGKANKNAEGNARERNERVEHNQRNQRNERTQREERNERVGAGKAESRHTTGQGAAATHLSTEQRTKIVHVFRQHNFTEHRVEHVNFSVNVGVRVPHSVHIYSIPTEVVDVYPEWRGYDYIVVGDEILIIDPGSYEIIAILNV